MDADDTLRPPPGFDARYWMVRWDRMQERYLVRRAQRFAVMTDLIRQTQGEVSRVLDLGCGPGSLTRVLLESFPRAEVVGIDFDPAILLLVREVLAGFGARVRFVQADLRDASWCECCPAPMDAVVSSTALHWLGPEQLSVLYRQVAEVLRPGGIFLNADHVGSDVPAIQKAWERNREQMRLAEGNASADDWHGFWEAYGRAVGVDTQKFQQWAFGDEYAGVEEGLPLAWHLDELKKSGFSSADCFWRCDCDAIYGGIV